MHLWPLALTLALTVSACAQPRETALPGFETNTAKRSIELSELRSGGPPKYGIPALDDPQTIAPEAATWLDDREPVVLLRVGGAARIYPLQILTWHEIANDTLGGVPVAVTFCPLCYAAVAFDRRLAPVGGSQRPVADPASGEQAVVLGVSGLLRHSDMVMIDRETETLWQQITGEAIVGDLLGTTLRQLPAQIVSFADAKTSAPQARVLSRETGHDRDYGRNPYAGYDDIDARPFLFEGKTDDRLPPLAHLIALEASGDAVAVSFDNLRQRPVWQGEVGGEAIAVFWSPGTATALGDAQIARGSDRGAVGAFRPVHGGRPLAFEARSGAIVDAETGSTWSITGEATAGPLAGARLETVAFHDTFAFAWFAFRPDTRLVE